MFDLLMVESNQVKIKKVEKPILRKSSNESFVKKVNVLEHPVSIGTKVAVFHPCKDFNYVGKAVLQKKDNDEATVEFINIELSFDAQEDKIILGSSYSWPCNCICKFELWKPQLICHNLKRYKNKSQNI